MKTYEEVKAIKEKYEGTLFSKENVVGVGIGKTKEQGKSGEMYCIRVYVQDEKAMEACRKILPEKLDGVDVELFLSGTIHAQENPED